jgi:hypothetical protein
MPSCRPRRDGEGRKAGQRNQEPAVLNRYTVPPYNYRSSSFESLLGTIAVNDRPRR